MKSLVLLIIPVVLLAGCAVQSSPAVTNTTNQTPPPPATLGPPGASGTQLCEPGYLQDKRCLGKSFQQEYQLANCSAEWRELRSCDIGCAADGCQICAPNSRGCMNDSVAWNCSSDGMTKNENVCEWSCWKDRCLTEWEWYSPRVSRAITGDTIELTDGRIVKLIGIRAPSIGEPYFEQSRKSLQDYITNNSICLSADEQDRDEEGNFLRYVGLSYNSSYPNYQMPTCPGWNLNRLQLTGGFAYFKPQTPNLKQISELRSIESGAINSNVNIWSFASGWIPTCLDLLDFIWDAQGDDSTNLNGEIVLLKNGCMNPINMTGWYLLDNDGNIYRFPNFILDGGKYARVHSGIGIDNATDLYWNSTVEIWSNDIVWKGSSGSTYRDTLALRDSDGKLYFWQWLS